jgi:hypothetical protein
MPICHSTFIALKRKLVEAPILVRLEINKPFILDVDWSIKGVGAIWSKKARRQEQVIAYAGKGSPSHHFQNLHLLLENQHDSSSKHQHSSVYFLLGE